MTSFLSSRLSSPAPTAGRAAFVLLLSLSLSLLLGSAALAADLGTNTAADTAANTAVTADTTDAGPPAQAAEAAKPANKPDTPASSTASPGVPVRVVHTGSDGLGARLALALKETFATSPIFAPVGKDIPQIRVLLSTKEEFGGRPGLGSVFAVTWVYSENEGTLKYHLASDVGFLDAQSLKQTARELAARTAQRAEQYAYLLR